MASNRLPRLSPSTIQPRFPGTSTTILYTIDQKTSTKWCTTNGSLSITSPYPTVIFSYKKYNIIFQQSNMEQSIAFNSLNYLSSLRVDRGRCQMLNNYTEDSSPLKTSLLLFEPYSSIMLAGPTGSCKTRWMFTFLQQLDYLHQYPPSKIRYCIFTVSCLIKCLNCFEEVNIEIMFYVCF